MTKKNATKRTVSEAAKPDVLDLAMQPDGDDEDLEVRPVAAKPVGSLTAPKKRAAAAPPPPPSDLLDEDEDDAEDDDAEDDEDDEAPESGAGPRGGKAVNAKFWADAAKLGPAHAKGVSVRKTRLRLLNTLKGIGRWDITGEPHVAKAVAMLEEADALLGAAVNALGSVDHDWRPKKHKRPATEPAKLVPGTKVAVRERALKGYRELEEDPSVFGNLTVHMHAANKVVAFTSDGTRYVFPRGQLVVKKREAAADGDA